MSNYGKRGGTSVNAGKKGTTYTATAPDGTILTKRSFQYHSERAYIAAYQHEGVWHAAGVCVNRTDDRHPIYHTWAFMATPATTVIAEHQTGFCIISSPSQNKESHMNDTLSLKGLSPTTRRTMLGAIVKLADMSVERLEEDLPSYEADSGTHAELVGWRDAAKRLRDEAAAMAKADSFKPT